MEIEEDAAKDAIVTGDPFSTIFARNVDTALDKLKLILQGELTNIAKRRNLCSTRKPPQ